MHYYPISYCRMSPIIGNSPKARKYFGEYCLSRTRAFEWCKMFREGTEREREGGRIKTKKDNPGWKSNGNIPLKLGRSYLSRLLLECRAMNAEYYSNILLGEVKERSGPSGKQDKSDFVPRERKASHTCNMILCLMHKPMFTNRSCYRWNYCTTVIKHFC